MNDRRSFLTGALSCGTLFAASRLPAFADEPTVFPARGRFSPTAMQYVVAGNYMFHAAEVLVS